MALQYDGTSTGMSITAGGLASNAARSSAAATTSTSVNLYDILLKIRVLTTATAPSGNKQVVVYAYTSVDGTNYSGASGTVDDVDGTDKTLTAIGSPTNLIRLGVLALNQGANARTIEADFSLMAAVGFLPPKFGVVLHNDAGTALGATVTVEYRGVYYT